MSEPLLRVENLVKHFKVPRATPWDREQRVVRAVDNVSFDVRAGETLALVGESGCGKTTTARLVLRLLGATSGRIVFEGRDVTHATGDALRRYWRSVQAVFQDPWSSLDPRMRVGDIVGEPLRANRVVRAAELRGRVAEAFEEVGLDPASASSYPHEFSGGMRQRIAIARALSLHPMLIVLDEPMSSLDVSVRVQIMNLLKDLQERFGLSYLLIAHDLASVRYLANRVAVMYLGEIVETATAEKAFTEPSHPYTRALLAAAQPARLEDAPAVLSGEVPSPTNPPSGCRFHTRCPSVFEPCSQVAPVLRSISTGHGVACHLYGVVGKNDPCD